MTFVTIGLAIAGALSIAVPIIIHILSRQRRKPVEWAAMRFLIEAMKKHRRRLQLEQLILLAVRCLVLALLGFALARPILERAGVLAMGGNRVIVFVLDNGMASGARDAQGRTALEKHVEQINTIVASLGPGDSIGLITAARPASAIVMPPSTAHGSVLRLLETLAPAESPTDLAAGLTVLQGAMQQFDADRGRPIIYLLSEFREGSASLDAPLPQLPASLAGRIELLAAPPANDPITNVQITSIEPIRSLVVPGSGDITGQITVRLARHGGEMASDVTRVRLSGEGLAPLESKIIQWEPGQPTADVDFAPTIQAAKTAQLGLTATLEDDSLPADNTAFRTLDVREQIRILLLDRRSFAADRSLDQLSAGQWIERALRPGPRGPMDVVEVDPTLVDSRDLRQADAAIIARPDLLTDAGWVALHEFVSTGGFLMIFPPAEINVHHWVDKLGPSGLSLPWQVALEAVDLPDGALLNIEQPASELLRLVSSELTELVRPVVVQRMLPVDMSQSQADRVLTLADGSPLMIIGAPRATSGSPAANGDSESNSRGLVAYIATAPELTWTNLPSKPLMIPLLHETIRQGLGLVRASQRAVVGDQQALPIARSAATIQSPTGQTITLSNDGRPDRPLDRSGIWIARDAAGQDVGIVAVNVEPSAGRTSTQSPAAVSAWLNASGTWQTFDATDPGGALRSVSSGMPLAFLLLLAVVALLVLEALLARLFSHASISRKGAPDLSGLRPTILEQRAAG